MSILSSLLEEMTTGTGAVFTPGEGEQFATPNAFGKKKKVRIRKGLSEAGVEISLTPEKAKSEYDKYLKDFDGYKSKVERYINVVEAMDIKTIIEDTTKLDQIAKVGEKMTEELQKIEDILSDIQYDMYEAGDKEGSKKVSDLEGSYWKLKKSADSIYQLAEDIVDLVNKIKRKQGDSLDESLVKGTPEFEKGKKDLISKLKKEANKAMSKVVANTFDTNERNAAQQQIQKVLADKIKEVENL